MDLFTRSHAVFSDCRLYRYRLERRWGEGILGAFLMLNPSTADEFQDDPTIRRCIGFAKREGWGGLVILNLFAFRATDPKDMERAADPIGAENDQHLNAASFRVNGPLVAAWGAHRSAVDRARYVTAFLRWPMLCLGTTADGSPRHPLYVSADTPLVPFNWRER
jgi:hypothetical protein